MQRRAYLPLVCILVGGLLFSGCTSRYGEQRTKVNYYPQCYEPVAQLRKDENSTDSVTPPILRNTTGRWAQKQPA